MEISGLARARVRRVVRARHRGRRPRGNFPAPWGAARRSVRVQGTRRRRGPARRRRRPRARLAAFRRGTVCSLLGGLLPDLVQLLSQTDPRRPVSVWPDAAAVASERCRVPTTQATAPTPPALGSRGALSASTGASCARCHRAPAPPERGGQLGAGSRSWGGSRDSRARRAAPSSPLGITVRKVLRVWAPGLHDLQGRRHPTARRATVAEGRWTKTTAVPLEPGVSLSTSPAHGVTPTRHTRRCKAGRQAATCSVTPPQVAAPPHR